MTRISTTLSLSQSLSTSSPTQPPQPRRQGQQRSRQKQQVKKIGSQQQHLQQQKQRQRRPYANLSIDELQQVTEYHLAQNIKPDGTLSLGRTSPQQLHIFTRLVAAWSKLLWWKDTMEDNHSNSNSSSSSNNNSKSNGVILLSKQERIMAAEMAEQCFRELIEEEDARRLLYMQQQQQQQQQTTIHDTATEIVTMITTPNLYYLVIRAWLYVVVDNNTDDGRYLRHATSLLDLMERRMMVLQSSSSRTQRTIANEIETATAVTKPQTVLSKQQQQDCIKCYELILNGWCKSKHNGAEIIAEEILHRLLSLITTTTTTKVATADAKTTPISTINNNFGIVRHYNNVINRIAASCKIDAGVHAERLLFELINLSSSSSSSSLNGGKQGRGGPDRNTYNAVMKAYAKAHSISSSSSTSTRSSNSGNNNNNSNNSNNNDAIANIERILQMMDTQSKLHGNNNSTAQITPDKISYTILLTALRSSSNNNNDMGKKAEEILQHMTREYTVNGNMNLKPDTVTYNAVLNVWTKCHQRHVDDTDDATTKCTNLLNDMLQRYNDIGDPDIRPDDVTFNTVLHAIANDAYLGSSGSISNDSNKKVLLVDDDDDDNSPPKRAVRLLEQMLLMGHQPDIITYNSVLNAFAKHGSVESARCAELMLNNLEELYDETKTLRQQQGKQESSRSLTSPSSSWNICPDLYSYNIVISAWANCGQADKAVALLDRMSTRTRDGKAMLIPDVTTYNTILHSWSQSLDRNAPVKALGLLEVMIRLNNNSNMQIGDDDDDDDDLPSNIVTATSAVTTSQYILDVTSFSTVINSFAKSRYPRKARQARMLLTRLKSFNHGSGRAVGRMRRKNETLLQPNVYVYTTVLNACAYSYGSDKEEALRIGISTYEELQRSTELKTNHVAYGSFIRVCRKLMAENDSRRDHYITRAFKQCCLDGQLSEFVLRQLHPMPRLYNLLLKEYINDDTDDVRYTDLPSNWSVKVKDRTKQRRLSLDQHSKA